MLLESHHRRQWASVHQLLAVHAMRRRIAWITAAAVAAVIAVPTAAAAYTETMFANNVSVPPNGSVTSVTSSHVGGKGFVRSGGWGGIRVSMLQGSGTIASATGSNATYVSLGPFGSSYANSRIQCKWEVSGPGLLYG